MEICNLLAQRLHLSPQKVTKKPRVSAGCNLVTFVTRFLMFYGYVRVRVRVYVNTYTRVTWLHYYIYVTNIYIYNKGLRSFLPVTFGRNLWCNLLNKVTSMFVPQPFPNCPKPTHAQSAARVSTTKTRHNGRADDGVALKPARKPLGGAGWWGLLLPAAICGRLAQARSYPPLPIAGPCDAPRPAQLPNRPGCIPERRGWCGGRWGSCQTVKANARLRVKPGKARWDFVHLLPMVSRCGFRFTMGRHLAFAVPFCRVGIRVAEEFHRLSLHGLNVGKLCVALSGFDGAINSRKRSSKTAINPAETNNFLAVSNGFERFQINNLRHSPKATCRSCGSDSLVFCHRLCPQSPALDCVSVIRDIHTLIERVNNYFALPANYFPPPQPGAAP